MRRSPRHGVGRAGDHDRRLPRAGGGDHPDAVVERDHGPRLFLRERLPLDAGEEGAAIASSLLRMRSLASRIAVNGLSGNEERASCSAGVNRRKTRARWMSANSFAEGRSANTVAARSCGIQRCSVMCWSTSRLSCDWNARARSTAALTPTRSRCHWIAARIGATSCPRTPRKRRSGSPEPPASGRTTTDSPTARDPVVREDLLARVRGKPEPIFVRCEPPGGGPEGASGSPLLGRVGLRSRSPRSGSW